MLEWREFECVAKQGGDGKVTRRWRGNGDGGRNLFEEELLPNEFHFVFTKRCGGWILGVVQVAAEMWIRTLSSHNGRQYRYQFR